MNTKVKSKTTYSAPVMVTFTPSQKEAVENYAAQVGLSMASFIRHKVLEEITLTKHTPTNNSPKNQTTGYNNKTSILINQINQKNFSNQEVQEALVQGEDFRKNLQITH